MYTHGTFVASTCMHLIHSGGFRFGDGFGYTYLSLEKNVIVNMRHFPRPIQGLPVAKGKGFGVCLYGICANLCEPPTSCEIICYVIYGIESIFSSIYQKSGSETKVIYDNGD